MRERISSWLAPTAAVSEVARRQYLLNLVLLGLAGPGFLFGLVMAVMWALGRAPIAGALAGFAVQPFYLLAYWLGRRGRVQLASYIPIIAVFLAMVGGSYQIGIGHVTLIGYAMVTLTAGILIGNGAALFFVLLSTGAYVLVGMAQVAGKMPDALSPEAIVIADAAGLGLGLVVLVIFSWLSTREMSRTLRHEQELSAELQAYRVTLEQQVAEHARELARRTAQLEAAAEVSRDVNAIHNVEQLLDETTRRISDRFGFYHAGVFLVDDAREYAVLQAASSEGGRRMLERGHKLAVGEVGIVGYVTGTGNPRIALDVGKDTVFFDNPDLPATRSEMALPLRAREEVIGALDVQSVESGAFSDDDVSALQIVADQLAVALENARLFEQARTSLREAQALYSDYSGAAWDMLARAGRIRGYTYNRVSVSPVAADRPPEVQRVLREGRVVAAPGESGGETTLAIPISVRGKTIGVLDISKSGKSGAWMPEETTIAERVSEQLALALERARLFEESRARAEELDVLDEMGRALTAVLDVDAVVEATYRYTSRLMDTTNFYVALYDPEHDTVTFPLYVEGERVRRLGKPRQAVNGLTEYIVRRNEPLLFTDGIISWAQQTDEVELIGELAKSWLGVPMIIGERVVGVIAVQSYTTARLYDEHHRDLLSAVASHTAIAIENARLFEETQRRAARERTIAEVGARIRESLEMETLLRTAAREMRRALGLEDLVVHLAATDDEGERSA